MSITSKRRFGRRAKAPSLYLVASPGGHLDLLCMIAGAYNGYDRVWLTSKGNRAELLRRQGERVHVLPHYDRTFKSTLSLVVRSVAMVARERPATVVTSGAGMVLPFCVVARLTGAKMIFIETMARVHNPSMSGRVLRRLTDRVIVQWPEMQDVYRGATLCRPALWETVELAEPGAGEGTFVAVGTHGEPFDRLLQAVDDAVGAGVLPKPVIVQSGVSKYKPRHYEPVAFLRPDEVEKAANSARYVVCHAGSGIISTALRAGRRPMVLPRLRRHGEHFDDHQEQIADKLGELGLLVRLQGEITAEHLRAADVPPAAPDDAGLPTVEAVLMEQLHALTGASR